METIASICSYCGCGCRLLFQVDNGKIVKVIPDRADDASEGIACIKGLTIHESVGTGEGRILQPLLRENKDAPFKQVSWNEAYRFIYEHTKDLAPSEVFARALNYKQCVLKYKKREDAGLGYGSNGPFGGPVQ